MDWFFDGLGTQIIVMVITLIITTSGIGIVGYKLVIKKKSSDQKQKAMNDAKQEQKVIFNSNTDDSNSDTLKTNKVSLKQKQQAGNNANQIQIGEFKHE